MENNGFYVTAAITSGVWSIDCVRSTLRSRVRNVEFVISVITNKCFLVACPNHEIYTAVLQLETLETHARAIKLQPWTNFEENLNPNLEPTSWGKVHGFPQFLRNNLEAVRAALLTMGNVIELDNCEWTAYDHRYLFIKMQFYVGVDTPCTFVAHINNRRHLLKIERSEHAHPRHVAHTFLIGFDYERDIKCFYERVNSSDLNTSDRYEAMMMNNDIHMYTPSLPTILREASQAITKVSHEVTGPTGWDAWPKSNSYSAKIKNDTPLPPPAMDEPTTLQQRKSWLTPTLLPRTSLISKTRSLPESSGRVHSAPFRLSLPRQDDNVESEGSTNV